MFSRSDLRNEVIRESIVAHTDPARPRVKTWCRCAICGKPEAKSNTVVDHILPVVDVTSSFEEQGADKTIDRLWCDKNNLQAVDLTCHNEKSRLEAKQRREYKNGKTGKATKKSSKKRLPRKP